ncbi:MAG: hypothetical protein QNJ45_16230 [Ardenticatenaceae bacterium]|nr:hypothetical protein [Ardenticatenaceae bacterium]
MKYRLGIGFIGALALSLLMGLTAVWATGNESSMTATGVFSSNVQEMVSVKSVKIALTSSMTEAPLSANDFDLPLFFLLSIGLMIVTTTAIVVSKDLFPSH